MKTLYVTDLDGTLLDTKERISPYSLNTINHLVQQGMHFTFATARSYHSASVLTKGLYLKQPVVIYNGSFLFEPNDKIYLHKEVFTKEQRIYLQSLTQKLQLQPLVYALVNGEERVAWQVGNEHAGLVRYLDSRKTDSRMTPLFTAEDLFLGEVFYLTCIGDKEQLEPLYHQLKDNNQFNCILQQELYRTEYWCEIMPKGATKANAVTKLKNHMGYERVVAFGDAINDIPLFTISDACYATQNATAPLKKLATDVIDSNDHDGVAKKLMELYRQNPLYIV